MHVAFENRGLLKKPLDCVIKYGKGRGGMTKNQLFQLSKHFFLI